MQLKCPPGGAQLGSMHFPIKKKKKIEFRDFRGSQLYARKSPSVVGGEAGSQETCEAKYSALHLGRNIPDQKSRIGAVRRAWLAEEKDQQIRNGGWGPPQALSSEYAYLPQTFVSLSLKERGWARLNPIITEGQRCVLYF